MAGKKHFPNGSIQYVFKRAGVLDKPLYLTFTDEAEGDAYAKRLDALLARGIVPNELREPGRVLTIAHLVREYSRDAHPSGKDEQQLSAVVRSKGATPLASIKSAWVDDWINELKREGKLAPATIRAKVGALARAADWGMRKGLVLLPDHPFRTLPDGYAQYTKLDTALAGTQRTDVERDRRLEPGEWEAIVAVLASGVLARKQRPLQLDHPEALRLLALMAVESAMRLREMYTLTIDQVDMAKKTIFLDRTKNGDKRQVPLSSVCLVALREYLAKRDASACACPDALLPWWDGEHKPRELARVSDYLSKLFAAIFEQAGCVDLRFHDLRHEATSRLFERTTLSEMQISKITGHRSMAMLRRYANLRGSDLAARMW
jgi:integrase